MDRWTFRTAVAIGSLAMTLAGCGTDAPRRATDPAEAPDVARFRCAADGSTLVLTPIVAAQEDGVHVEAAFATGEQLSYDVHNVGGGWGPGDGVEVFQVRPGTMQVACHRTLDLEYDPGAADWSSIHVVDPAGVYVEQDLGCAAASGVSGEHPSPLRGGDPIEAVGGALVGVRPTDTLQRVGYVARRDDAHVAVRREGQNVAVMDLQRMGAEWGWTSFVSCDDAGVSYRT